MLRVAILVLTCVNLYCQDLQQLDTTMLSVNFDELVVTAQYEPTHYKEAIHKVDIISRKEIEARGVTTLDQALVINPAIRISYDPVLGSTIRMRGVSSSNVAILMDGVPIIGRSNGGIDLSQINMQNIERIEIIQGALSNIYGSNAAGGVINIITKKSQLEKWKVDLGSQIESVGQQNYNTSIGRNFGKFLVSVDARYLNYDQYAVDSLRLIERIELEDNDFVLLSKYPFNPKEQIGAGGLLRYNPTEGSSVIAKYNYNTENVTDYGSIKRIQFNPYAQDGFFSTTRSDFSINYKKNWDQTFLDITSAYNIYDRIVDEKRFYIETSSFDSLLQTSDTTRFKTFFNRAILSRELSHGIKCIAGLNYSVEQGSGDRIINRMNPDSTIASFTEIAPFLEFKYSGIENLDFSATARYTHHSAYDGQLTPAIHLKYDISDIWTTRLSYAQGYRSPALKELYLEFIDINHNIVGNTDLQPEISQDIQMTVDYNPTENISAAINLYYTNIDDRIALVEYETLKFEYDNINAYQVHGLQPSLSYKVNNIQFQSSASIGYWSTSIDAESGPSYGRVFDMNNSMQISLDKSKVNLTINHRHTGSQPNYSLSNGTVKVRTITGFDLIDFSMNRSFFNGSLNTTLGIRNVFGVTSTSVTGAADTSASANHSAMGRNIVGRGRNIFVAAQFSF